MFSVFFFYFFLYLIQLIIDNNYEWWECITFLWIIYCLTLTGAFSVAFNNHYSHSGMSLRAADTLNRSTVMSLINMVLKTVWALGRKDTEAAAPSSELMSNSTNHKPEKIHYKLNLQKKIVISNKQQTILIIFSKVFCFLFVVVVVVLVLAIVQKQIIDVGLYVCSVQQRRKFNKQLGITQIFQIIETTNDDRITL